MPAEARLRVFDRNNQSAIGTLTQPYGRTMLSDLYGQGALTFSLDHASTGDMGLVDHRRIVRVDLRDGQGAWQTREAFVMEDFHDVLDDDTPSRVVRCSGLKAWLGYDRGGAVLYPNYDMDLRRNPREFSWRDFGADFSEWEEPESQGRYRSPSNAAARGLPPGWHDADDGEWIGHEQGPGIYRRELDLAARPEKKRQTILFGVGQGRWRMGVDGRIVTRWMPPFKVATFRTAWSRDRHVVTLECEDGPVLWFSASIGADGKPDGILYRTFTTAVFGAGDPDEWRTGPVKGVTRGFIEGTALQEAKDRGEIPNVTWDFDADEDSLGVAWADTIVHSFRLQKLGRLDDDVAGLLPGESWMTPAGLFRIAQRRGQDRSGDVTVSVPFGARIPHDGPRVTRGLYETPGGYAEFLSAAAEGQFGPMADFIQYGTGIDPANLSDAVARELSRLSREQLEVDLELPDDVVPYEDVELGDTVTVDVMGVNDPFRLSTFELADDPSTEALEWAATGVPDDA